MTELVRNLEKLTLRLDRMGMLVEQALMNALHALQNGDPQAGEEVSASDARIDREEVEIEQEAIRLMARFQPTAIDLRTIFSVVKANNDLERIADHAAKMGRQVKYLVQAGIDLSDWPNFEELALWTSGIVAKTARILTTLDKNTAQVLISADNEFDQKYNRFLRSLISMERSQPRGGEVVLTLATLARSLERINDLCANIAEDVIFLRTGNIVRHISAGPSNEG